MAINGVRMGDWVAEIEATVDVAAHAAADVLFDLIELADATMDNGTSVIQSIVVTDYDDQGAAFDLLFFRSGGVSTGTANATITLSDNAVAECIGHVSITASNYSDLGGCQVATKTNIGLEVRPDNGTSLWVAGVSRGTPTYAGGRLTIKVGLLRG